MIEALRVTPLLMFCRKIMNIISNPVFNELLPLELPDGIRLYVKREDKIHEQVSGNKFRKLTYNLQQAKKEGKNTLLTFGGAFSNHIAATAAAGKLSGFKTIGIIRGEELYTKIDENPTLRFAQECDMELHFVSRTDYREKHNEPFQKALKERFGGHIYILPEGGTNTLAIQGCEEILTPEDANFDIICSAVGTGGTISGLINASQPQQTVLGFPALQGDFLYDEIKKYTSKTNWELIFDYNLGGYAKITDPYITFLNDFNKKTGLPLDPIYTGKMFFAIFALIKQKYFKPNTKILAIHTGGLQGIEGLNLMRKKQHKETLHYGEKN